MKKLTVIFLVVLFLAFANDAQAATKLRWKILSKVQPPVGELCLVKRKLLGVYVIQNGVAGWKVDAIIQAVVLPTQPTDKWVSFRKLDKALSH
jgi:hypothetical protein